MNDLGLNNCEMRHILGACASLRLRDCTPEYLQDFIAARLDGPDPDLAIRVRQLSNAQMHELCLWIMREQGNGRHPPSPNWMEMS